MYKRPIRRGDYTGIMAENITGFYTTLDTGRPGPCVPVLAETCPICGNG